MKSSPRLALHRRAHTYCAFCPKLCRFACPVATQEASETTTPWAKMTSLHHVAEGNLPLTAEHAASYYACSGCLRCRSFCEHDIEVAAALGSGRAEAVGHAVAPEAAFRVIEEFAADRASAQAASRRLFGSPSAPARVGYAPGSFALRQMPDEARAGYEVVKALSGQAPRVIDEDPGFDLLEAGDEAGFQAACRQFLDELTGLQQLIVLDPDTLYAVRHVAPQFGLESPVSCLHLSELADAQLTRFSRVVDGVGRHRYLDACKLGRGLGIYDPPRRVLARVLGRAPEEPYATREQAECSGAGGLLPRTRPETAAAIACARLDDHRRAEGQMLISACPSAQHALSAAGDVDVRGFASLLWESLSQGLERDEQR
ncbi:MAG: (Fe-S)-binding protein [Deltaproteobacteria bacterium]|nr:(Fe-S)-binding protein [Deltaproteobacteria bacterium]